MSTDDQLDVAYVSLFTLIDEYTNMMKEFDGQVSDAWHHLVTGEIESRNFVSIASLARAIEEPYLCVGMEYIENSEKETEMRVYTGEDLQNLIYPVVEEEDEVENEDTVDTRLKQKNEENPEDDEQPVLRQRGKPNSTNSTHIDTDNKKNSSFVSEKDIAKTEPVKSTPVYTLRHIMNSLVHVPNEELVIGQEQMQNSLHTMVKVVSLKTQIEKQLTRIEELVEQVNNK